MRVYKKKRTTSDGKKKLVQTIKKVIANQAETKSYISSTSLSPIDDGTACANLIYPISVGANDTNIVGTKFQLKHILIKAQLFNIVGAGTNNNIKLCRVVVFRTKKALTNTTTAAISNTDLWRTSVSIFAARGHVDLRKVTLLADKQFTLTPPSGVSGAAGVNVQKAITMKIPFNTTEYFDSNSSGYLKDSNIYLAFTAYDGSGVIAPCTFSFQWAVNFKDE